MAASAVMMHWDPCHPSWTELKSGTRWSPRLLRASADTGTSPPEKMDDLLLLSWDAPCSAGSMGRTGERWGTEGIVHVLLKQSLLNFLSARPRQQWSAALETPQQQRHAGLFWLRALHAVRKLHAAHLGI